MLWATTSPDQNVFFDPSLKFNKNLSFAQIMVTPLNIKNSTQQYILKLIMYSSFDVNDTKLLTNKSVRLFIN